MTDSNGRSPSGQTDVHPALEVGDLIRWTINGQDQFPEPRAILKLDTRGGKLLVFVEGTSSGIPADQVAVIEPDGPLPAAISLNALGYWSHLIHPNAPDWRPGTRSEKRPIGGGWGLTRWDEKKLRRTARRYPAAGVGISFGPGRAPGGGHLIDLEGDGPEADASLARLLGGELVETPSWWSSRGGHALFAADGGRLPGLLAAAGAKEGDGVKKGVWHLDEFPDLEWRVGGYKDDGVVKQVQSVCPPTIGDDGRPRRWRIRPTVPVADLPEAAYASLEAIAERKAIEAEANGHADHDGNGHVNGKHAGPAPATFAGRASNNGAADVEKRVIAYLATIEPSVSGQGGSNKTFGAVCRVGPGFDLTEDEAYRLISTHYNPRCVPPWSEKEMRHKIADAYKKVVRRGRLLKDSRRRDRKAAAAARSTASTVDGRLDVEVNTRRHEVLERTIVAVAKDADLYCRGQSLGVVIREENDTVNLPGGVELTHARGSLRFVPVAQSVLGCRLTRVASFFRWAEDDSGELVATDCHPPDWLIAAVADHRYWPGVRSLLTITECPYILADGSMARPGFDRATGTLYRPSFDLPTLPANPTAADARLAVDRLGKLVEQFPFEDQFSFAAWIANLLTCIQRPVIAGPVPGFAYNGNAAGCGKGLLIDINGILVFGSSVGTRPYPMDPAEAAKVKLALALAAVPIVHFDNLTEGGFYGGGVIDSALTSTVASDRILGQSRDSGNVPLRPVWTLSGNNVSPVKDADRRWLSCNLVTTLEKPYERGDIREKNLAAHVAAHRPELVHAALVILKAHAVAGRPPALDEDGKPAAPLGSYGEWDAIVRGAVWYATKMDCLETQRRGASEKPDRLDKAALLEGWLEIDPDREGKTIEDAIRLAADDMAKDTDKYPTLRAALLSISRDNKLPSVDKVKYKVRSIKKTPINKMRFESDEENRNHQKLWKVVAC